MRAVGKDIWRWEPENRGEWSDGFVRVGSVGSVTTNGLKDSHGVRWYLVRWDDDGRESPMTSDDLVGSRGDSPRIVKMI